MAGNLNRSFSFNDHDEESLSANREYYDTHSPPSLPAYTDSPVRQYHIPPPPPQHRDYANPSYELPPINTDTRGSRELDHTLSNRTTSTTTPGADNLGEAAAGGGIAGVALGVANTNARESGLEAMRSVESLDRVGAGIPPERGYNTVGSDTPYIPMPPPNRLTPGADPFASPAPSRLSNPFEENRHSSIPPSQGSLTPRGHQSRDSIPMNDYHPQEAYANNRASSYLDNPYNRVSTAWDPMVVRGDIDPDAIDDDGDDGMNRPPTNSRSSAGSHHSNQDGVSRSGPAAAGGVLGALGGLIGRKNAPSGSRDASGHYGPVGGPMPDGGAVEKSEWLNRENSGRKRLRWIVGILIVAAVVGGIVGGVIAAVNRSKTHKNVSGSSGDSDSATSSPEHGGKDLDKNSPEIKKLLNNADLHKVFPGVDYTPFNAQYPDCLSNPPIQSNVTKDVAVLSQLTNTIRLYGTDCNQTEMVLHAIDKLELTDVKVWLGVWLDKNKTTNARGLNAMHDILSKNGADPFAGVIVGNEVLFREELTETELGTILSDVRKNFTSLNIDLPLATSDLGDDWTASLASSVDVVMSNIHPFFAGVTVDEASGWTWTFWQEHDTILTQGSDKKNVISEVGWPSGGGTDCGEAETCAEGSVAGIDEMNKFMETFVCQSLDNGTNFFWFEAFDEPWKIRFNEPGKEWEDKWGLMDPARKLKPGLKIPDCGGKTV